MTTHLLECRRRRFVVSKYLGGNHQGHHVHFLSYCVLPLQISVCLIDPPKVFGILYTKLVCAFVVFFIDSSDGMILSS